MINRNFTAINAVNNGTDTPDAFYNKTKLMATSKWISTDGWRGYNKLTPEPGYKIIHSDWVTGDCGDAVAEEHGETPTEERLKLLEAEHGTIYVIYTPTSNVFSTAYDVLIKSGVERKGKTVAHKTKLYEEADGSYAVKYHATDVIKYNAKTNKYTLNSGGWLTRTTKERINAYLPGRSFISQHQFKWTLHHNGDVIPFKDNMVI